MINNFSIIKSIFSGRNNFFFLGLVILLVVILINIFPNGYVFGGGDTTQFIDATENIKDFIFNKGGSGYIFYFLFCFLDLIGISDSIQLSFYLGFILLIYTPFFFLLVIGVILIFLRCMFLFLF